jgi:hypothetical protein
MNETVEMLTEILSSITDSPRIAELQAKYAKQLLDFFMAQGFTREEALQLIIASQQKLR